MKFQSHVPGFVDAEPAVPLRQYKNLEELLLDPWIMSWRQTAGMPADFEYCWSSNTGRWSKAILMCQWTTPQGLKKWWVLGYMDEVPDLPEWKMPHQGFEEDDEF